MQMTHEFKHSKILVIGSGEASQRAAKVSRERGAAQITVLSRSSKKGKAFAREIQGKWSPMSSLEKELVDHDIVLCCSGAPHTVLKMSMVKEAMKLRSQHPLFIIDIGVPCNVDREVKGLKNVFLHDIDELTAICQINYEQRRDEIQKAESIIKSEKENFMAYWHELKVKPIIKALVNKAENIRQEKLISALKKSPDLTDRERAQFELLSKSITQKLLHEPIQCLKANHKNEEYLRIVNQLFRLDEEK
jgi:glutamyl-tRNA reductase